jgi:hypothetical protein
LFPSIVGQILSKNTGIVKDENFLGKNMLAFIYFPGKMSIGEQ